MKPSQSSRKIQICLFESLESRRLMSTTLSLDPAFGKHGIAAPGVQVNSPGPAPAVALQQDGKILIVDGYEDDVVRLNPDGSIDPTFSTTGGAALSAGQAPTAVFVQADGKVLIAGKSLPWSDGGSIARLNPDGSIDSTFGNGGRIDVAFNASMIVQQSDGSLYVAGTAGGSLEVTHLNADGTTDSSYGSAGVVTIGATDGQLLLAPDGKLFVVGQSAGAGGSLVFARLNTDGSIDASFNHGSAAVVSHGAANTTLTDAALLPDGTVIAVVRDSSVVTLMHVNFDGSLDTTFGSGGLVSDSTGANFMGGPMKVFYRATGEIVIEGFGTEFAYAGHFTPGGQLLHSERTAAYDMPGAPGDPTPTPIPAGLAVWSTNAGAIDADGDLIAAGNTSKLAGGGSGFVYPLVAARIEADNYTWVGDPSFQWNPYPQPDPQPQVTPPPAPGPKLFNDRIQIRSARKTVRNGLSQQRDQLHTDLTTFHLAREAGDNTAADLSELRKRIRQDRAAIVAYRRHGLAGVFAARKQLRADLLQIKKAKRNEGI